jgi:ABC-2 type transport system ATP-binding protein
MSPETAIKVENLSKSFMIPHKISDTFRERLVRFEWKKKYELLEALKDVSFEVREGEFFGIIGRNGSGKSTLLKILAGIYTPGQGKVTISGQVSPFLELGVGFNPELSGRDNIFLNGTILGLSGREIRARFDSIVNFSEMERFIDQKLKNYSSGMQVRLAFAVAIHANRGILLMDEVLAVGDSNFQRKCLAEFSRFRNEGNTVVLVSHDIFTVSQSCDRVALLRNGEIVKTGKAEEVCNDYLNQNLDPEGGRP